MTIDAKQLYRVEVELPNGEERADIFAGYQIVLLTGRRLVALGERLEVIGHPEIGIRVIGVCATAAFRPRAGQLKV